MVQIFELMRKSNNIEYIDEDKIKQNLEKYFTLVTQLNLQIPDVNGRITNGGNGRLVRNIFQKIITERNSRIINENITDQRVTMVDVLKGFENEIRKIQNRKI